jgi:hypothetical protein
LPAGRVWRPHRQRGTRNGSGMRYPSSRIEAKGPRNQCLQNRFTKTRIIRN